MTINEVAMRLECSRTTITRMMNDGKMPFIEVGGHRRVPTAWFRQFVGLDIAEAGS